MIRPFWKHALTALLAAAPLTPAAASDYPLRPITIVVPFAAGGPTDLVMRVLGQKMAGSLGQPLMIENRGGAGGRNGAEYVAHVSPDGYTLLLANVSSHAIVPATVGKVGYDPISSFSAIAPVASYPLVMICNPKVPARDVRELIDYARRNPGKLTFGSPGAGGQGHLAGEFFKSRAKVEMLHIPYKGTGPLLQDVMAGVVDCMFDGTSQSHIEHGSVRAMALTSGRRDPSYPGVPTFEEIGLHGLDMMTWMGLMGPANLPDEVVRKNADAANAALADKQVAAAIKQIGATPTGGGPADLTGVIRQDLEMYREVVKDADIKVE